MGYQPKKSNSPEKRNPPKGGSNVTPPPSSTPGTLFDSVVSTASQKSRLEVDDSTLSEIIEEVTAFVNED